MRRNLLGILSVIFLIAAILGGYYIFYLNDNGAYESSGYYNNKKVLRTCYAYSYRIQNQLEMLLLNGGDEKEFLNRLAEEDMLLQNSNIRIGLFNYENKEIKSNLNAEEKVHQIYNHQIITLSDTIFYMDLYLVEDLPEKDEFYDLYTEYRFFQKVRIPVIIVEIIFILMIIFIFWKQIRSGSSHFPLDLALLFQIMGVFLSSMLWYWSYQSKNTSIEIILFQLAALIQYASVVWVCRILVSQKRKGILLKNMVLTGINQKAKHVPAILCPVICQCVLSYFWFFQYRQKNTWIFISLQAILLLAEVIMVLVWMARSHSNLASAVEQQIKSERLKTELITNVSHDIKTPITSIINYVDLVKKEEIHDEKIKEYIEVVERQSLKLKKLVMDVIEASKAATGNIHPEMMPLDIWELLRQGIGEYEEQFRSHELEVVLSRTEDIKGTILADGDQLWRVFDNLLSNICKYSMNNTRVYIDALWDDQNIVILFKNISRDQLNITEEELFERFVRGDSSRHTEGSGLGLTIAKSLTELMGGTLTLEIEGDLFRARLSFPQFENTET